MERFDVGARVVSKGDAPLVAHDNDAASGAIQSGDGGFGSRKKLHVAPPSDIFSFRRLAIDDTVAIQEDVRNLRERVFHRMGSGLRAIVGMR
jgi:hypothetical protein